MQTMTDPTTSSPAMLTSATRHHRQERNLRRVLTMNATTSGLGGLAAVVAANPVADLLGTDQVGWVRIVGAGLVAFAAFVAMTARASSDFLRRETPWISAGDAAWVVGTILTIALGWYSTSGAIVMGVVGVMVGAFGIAQVRFVRQLASHD